MSDIRDRDEFRETVNRLMISAMEDIDVGRNEAGDATLALVDLLELHDLAQRALIASQTARLEQLEAAVVAACIRIDGLAGVIENAGTGAMRAVYQR